MSDTEHEDDSEQEHEHEHEREQGHEDIPALKARLDKLLTDATKDTFDRCIHTVAKLVIDGLDELDTGAALIDTGRRLGLTTSQRDALTGRLAKAMQGINEMKDAKAGKGPKASGSKASALVKLAWELFDFALDDRGLIATPKEGGDPLWGNEIQSQLATTYHDLTGTAPTTAALRDAMRVLQGEAQRNAPPVQDDNYDDIPDEDGAALLNDLVKFLDRYLILPSVAAKYAMSLWVLHTWAIKSFVVSPRLVFRSATKRCGKSRALEVLYCLCRGAELSLLPTAPVIYRLTAAEQPTWMLDEYDNLKNSNPESLSAILMVLNGGYRLGATVARLEKEGDTFVTIRHSIFAPVSMAGIGKFSDTTEDRSVVIEIQRKLKIERTAKFHIVRTFNDPATVTLRRRCAAWAKRHAEVLSVAEPKVPDQLDDRAIECWETLTAIAEEAGGRWPRRAQDAAMILSGPDRESGSDSENTQMSLLTDLRTLWFTDKRWRDGVDPHANGQVTGTPKERMPSEDICDDLARLEESEWATFTYKRDPITQAGLARLLRHFNLRSTRFRVEGSSRYGADDDGVKDSGERNVRGYYYADFVPVWERLLPPFKEEKIRDEAPEGGR